MASVEARLTRRGGRDVRVYDVRFRDPDGRQRRRTFPRKGPADQFAATVEADKLRGEYVDHSHHITVAEYARTWAAARPHRPTTARRVSSLIETHIAGTRLGDRRLCTVRPTENVLRKPG